jgi:hypothetical protein
MDGFQKDLKRHYKVGFNDGLYHATDFLKSVATDLNNVTTDRATEDAIFITELSDVILEDLKEEHDDD